MNTKDNPKEKSFDFSAFISLGASEQDKESSPVLLSEHARKITLLKEGLLSTVRGQRHAVDEVVQSIFQCELFAKHNPERKGPLATFLFTGPSGVGKTYLAEQCGRLLGRKMLTVDMSEFSDNLSGNKFNGEHGQSATVTEFVRENPDGILVFDEIEKAHINTIHLFLQILDCARLMDYKINKEVSFRNNIIIMTTNAGRELYENSAVYDLSGIQRSVILDALANDVNPQNDKPYFPECIISRMANGHVILFNRLEPFALMEIVRSELETQVALFEKSTGIKVVYDPKILSALVLYHGGGTADARTLRGLAREIIVGELQEMIMQIYSQNPKATDTLKTITVQVNTESTDKRISGLFVNNVKMYAAVFTDGIEEYFRESSQKLGTEFDIISDEDVFKRRIRGVTDYVIIDPLCDMQATELMPKDIEDIDSGGMRMFNYLRDFAPEIPIYILNAEPNMSRSFDTLLVRGAKGIIALDKNDAPAFTERLSEISFGAVINNAVMMLERTGKYLSFNCAQYHAQYNSDKSCAVISAEQLMLKNAPTPTDKNLIAKKGANNNVKFSDVTGCKKAKEILKEYCAVLDNPRGAFLSGKGIPKGVLLYGPAGTGKTMLAKAMANECGATFIPTTATSFFGSLVGETEKNIRELFAKARKYAPSVIFIDEADAIAKKRTGSSSTAHSEDALNTLLSQMDGFTGDEQRPVFILAATNYEISGSTGQILDKGFVRRFDNKIMVPLPDTDDRRELISKLLKKHSIDFKENNEKALSTLATRTSGMSNADIESMVLQYIRSLGTNEPDHTALLDTLDSYRYGEINKTSEDELRSCACHEAGHALVSRLCGVTPLFLTVVSRGNYNGYTESPDNENSTYTYSELMNMVCRCLAGRIAETELFGASKGINSGAGADIRLARYYVKTCLEDYGMGKRLYSGFDAEEGEALMRKQLERTEAMIKEHREILLKLTDLLVSKKSLDQPQLDKFFKNEGI